MYVPQQQMQQGGVPGQSGQPQQMYMVCMLPMGPAGMYGGQEGGMANGAMAGHGGQQWVMPIQAGQQQAIAGPEAIAWSQHGQEGGQAVVPAGHMGQRMGQQWGYAPHAGGAGSGGVHQGGGGRHQQQSHNWNSGYGGGNSNHQQQQQKSGQDIDSWFELRSRAAGGADGDKAKEESKTTPAATGNSTTAATGTTSSASWADPSAKPFTPSSQSDPSAKHTFTAPAQSDRSRTMDATAKPFTPGAAQAKPFTPGAHAQVATRTRGEEAQTDSWRKPLAAVPGAAATQSTPKPAQQSAQQPSPAASIQTPADPSAAAGKRKLKDRKSVV